MTYPDFQAPAELYLGSDWPTALAQGPRTFRSAAKAIRFALEEAAPVSLRGARLLIGNAQFSREAMGWLYRSQDYPLSRKSPFGGKPAARGLTPTRRFPAMDEFDYAAGAELFPSRRYAKTQQTRYRRFATAAEAIRYIIEDLPANGRAGSFLEVDEQRFEGDAIRALYDADAYPLTRQTVAA